VAFEGETERAGIEEPGRWRGVLRAMSSRNYRLFFAGQLVALIGSWIGQLAMSWLVYEMTGSKTLLGLVAFSGQIPTFLLSPWAGVLVDRWKLHRALVVSQALSMTQVLTLAALTLTGVVTPLHIILLAIAQGIINAFDLPARQAIVVKMVDRREDLANAIALNSMMFNASRLIGPAAAGTLIAVIGTGNCLLVNGLSYLAVILSLLAINLKEPQARDVGQKRIWTEFREGFHYVVSSLPIRSLLIQLGVVSLLATPYAVLLPVFAKDVFNGGPAVLGGLTASIGCGALLGGIGLASRRSVLGLGKWIAAGAAIQGVSLILFAVSRFAVLGMVCLMVCGFAQVAQMASGNTVLQTIVDDDKRGRVMAFHAMAFMGTMPLGSLLAGSLASTWLGATGTVAITGIGCILIGGRFAVQLPKLRDAVRPIYQRCGVLPVIAEGLQSADLHAADKSIAG
jgi:MFS family permease